MQNYKIILTNEELNNLNSFKGTKKLGYYGECIMLHIIEQLKDTRRVRHITNKKEQIKLGDIKYKTDTQHYMECKIGRIWNGTYKACIDGKYTYKGSNGTTKYTQQSGCDRPWLYHQTYDSISFIFEDRVYIISNATTFLDTVREGITEGVEKYGSKENFNTAWYKQHTDFPISTGLTGGITDSNKTYETFTVFVDIEKFCSLHNLQYYCFSYEVLNSELVHGNLF